VLHAHPAVSLSLETEVLTSRARVSPPDCSLRKDPELLRMLAARGIDATMAIKVDVK
jgi:hypothetical protein